MLIFLVLYVLTFDVLGRGCEHIFRWSNSNWNSQMLIIRLWHIVAEAFELCM